MSGVVYLEEVGCFPVGGKGVFRMAALTGDRIATGHGDPDNVVRVWTTTGALVATLEGHADIVCALATTPGGDIVSGSCDGTVKVWHDYACVHTLRGHTGWIRAVAVSSLEGIIVSGSDDYTAKVWLASSGECVATLEGHTNFVSAVCVLENGDIVTGSWDKTARVWARGSWTCTAVYEERDQVLCVSILPGGGLAVGGGDYGTAGFVSVWGGGVREWAMETATIVYQLGVVQDIIVACTYTSVYVIQDGVCLQQWSEKRPRVFALPSSGLAVSSLDGDSTTCRVYRVVRPSRLATIHLMITAWSAHGGTPPPASDWETAASALGRTLSLRRLCRARVVEGAVEIVEPFARNVVGYM